MSTTGTLHTPNQIADRRAQALHASMFTRMLLRAAVLRRRRAAAALLAMVVAAAVATAMMNLYVDVQAKLRTEFRNYGANVVIVGKNGQSLPADALAKVESATGPGAKTLAVPFSYAVARTKDGQSVVVVGTDFTRARQLNHWWKVSHWPDEPNQALIGMRAASVVSPSRQPFELTFQGKLIELTPAGMLQTGAGEDSRIYLDQSEFQNWTGVSPSTIEVAVNGTAAEVESFMRQLAQLLPSANVRPVRQIMEGLGASERLVNGFFAAEAAAMGAVGAILGFFIGIGVAVWIGRANFHAPVVPRFSVFPYVLAGSVAVALISAILPITMLRRVQPAIILRGE